MKTTVQKWGNSLGVRIPKTIAGDLHIEEGSNVEITLEADRIVIVRKEIGTLAEKVSRINSENLHSEISTENPVGNEQW